MERTPYRTRFRHQSVKADETWWYVASFTSQTVGMTELFEKWLRILQLTYVSLLLLRACRWITGTWVADVSYVWCSSMKTWRRCGEWDETCFSSTSWASTLPMIGRVVSEWYSCPRRENEESADLIGSMNWTTEATSTRLYSTFSMSTPVAR